MGRGCNGQRCMSKRTGSLSPCKLQQHPGRWHLGNQDNNRRREAAENPSHPFLGIIMPHQLWQLITDNEHIENSQRQMGMHKYTMQYSVGFYKDGQAEGSAQGTSQCYKKVS